MLTERTGRRDDLLFAAVLSELPKFNQDQNVIKLKTIS